MIASLDFAPIGFGCTALSILERQSETCQEVCAQPARSSAEAGVRGVTSKGWNATSRVTVDTGMQGIMHALLNSDMLPV